jgi:hypothetical protein
MKRDVWRRLGKRFLTRLAIPMAVVFVLLFVLELWTMRARAQAERAQPRKPELDRRQQAPAPREFDRTLTRNASQPDGAVPRWKPSGNLKISTRHLSALSTKSESPAVNWVPR